VTMTTPTTEATETTPLFSLVALKLKEQSAEQTDPREWIRARRGPEETQTHTCPTCGHTTTTTPTPWRTIADELFTLTGIRVNHQTLINWSAGRTS
jgi:hypothetical protein